MVVGAVLYTALQVVMIGALKPGDIAGGWSKPLGGDPSDYGAWYTLALAVGLGWLAKALLVDAVISPAGTGIVYVGTSARLSYALGEEREMPSALASTSKQGVPVVSILLAFIVGCAALGPFKSWNDLVKVVTSATAIMYAFAPLSLAALHKLDGQRPRAYRVPRPKLMLPATFCAANLIIYWGGFDVTWKLLIAVAVGLALFAFGAWRKRTRAAATLRSAVWLLPWLGGHFVIGFIGRYGNGCKNWLPDWVDILVVIGFSLAIFYYALGEALTPEATATAIAKDAHQIDYDTSAQ
jgi:amino acid transporter